MLAAIKSHTSPGCGNCCEHSVVLRLPLARSPGQFLMTAGHTRLRLGQQLWHPAGFPLSSASGPNQWTESTWPNHIMAAVVALTDAPSPFVKSCCAVPHGSWTRQAGAICCEHLVVLYLPLARSSNKFFMTAGHARLRLGQ